MTAARTSSRFLKHVCALAYCMMVSYAQVIADVYRDSLLRQPFAVRQIFFSTKNNFHEDSALFFSRLKLAVSLAEEEDDDELRLHMQMIRCDYYCHGKQHDHQRAEQELPKLIDIARAKGYKGLEIDGRLILGTYFSEQELFGKSLEQHLLAYYEMKPLSVEEIPSKKYVILQIAQRYYYFGDYDNALHYLREAHKVPAVSVVHPKSQDVNLVNTIGLIYRERGRYDSALHYFRQAYTESAAAHDTLWMAISGGNSGITYAMQGKCREAIPLLSYDVEICLRKREVDNGLTSLIRLVSCKMALGDASYIDDLALARSKIRVSMHPWKHLKGLYPLLARHAHASGNAALAYRYSDSGYIARDSVEHQTGALMLARSQQRAEAERYLWSMKLTEGRQKQDRIIRYALIAMITLLLIISWQQLMRQRLRHKLKQEHLLSEKLKAEAELAVSTLQLQQFTHAIQEKNVLIEESATEIRRLQEVVDGTELAQSDTINQIYQRTILTDEEWETFRKLFEKVHAGFLMRLREKFENLSPAETRFMALTRLKMTPKEMEAMLGIGAVAIRQYRYRLRRKLQLGEDESIDELVQRI